MKVVILGGGPSGLGVAWGLVERGFRDITILEKNPLLGGLSGSFSLWESKLDYGPHRFSPEYPELVTKISRLLGTDWIKATNEHCFWFEDQLYHYPPRLSDFLNSQSLRFATEAALGLAWEKTAGNGKRLLGSQRTTSFQAELERRFGRVVYERLLGPMAEKVWGDNQNIDPDFAALRFSLPPLRQWVARATGVSQSFNDSAFYYPRHGFQQLWDRLGQHLADAGVKIVFDARLTSIGVRGQNAATVHFSQHGQVHTADCDYLVSTIPSQHFIRLLHPSPFTPAQVMSTQFATRGMLLCNFLVQQDRTLPARVMIFPEKNFLFNRLSEQNQFSRDTVKAGFSAIQADLLSETDSSLWNTKDAEILTTVLSQIADTGLLDIRQVRESKLMRIPFAYPIPTHKREREQRDLNELLLQYSNILCTGRFASSDYNNSHTALKKGMSAAEVVASEKTLAEWMPEAEDIRKTAIRD